MEKTRARRMGGRFDVAVFPMADAVLFPGTTLPLHIFEDRFGQMVHDARARGWPLAVALVEPKPGSPQEYRLNSICGAGDVQVCKEYKDGRTDILVHGVRRVRLVDFVQREPYIVMQAEELVDEWQGGDQTEKLEELQSLVQAWSFMNPDLPDELSILFEQFIQIGDLCDFFAFHFIRKVSEKQKYLNRSGVEQRAQRLEGFLKKDLMRQAKRQLRAKRGALSH